jgi:ectoine hydroxylase-related dioxygenase (phytanoyl-CoA dioxygenase family)
VTCGDFEASLTPEEAGRDSADGNVHVRFHLMTHLLANGEQAIEATVEFESGERAVFPRTTLQVTNSGPLAEAVAHDLRAHGAPAIFGWVVDSTLFPYAGGRARAQFDLAANDAPLSLEPATDLDAAHRHLRRWGFCILPQTLPAEIVESFRIELDLALETGRLPYRRGSSDRIHNAHRLPSGRAIWLYPPVLSFLEAHFQDTPCACQTLTYVNGSQQSAHQDTIHLTPYPAGYMCGVWIALEDVHPDSGELFVYPGSHREKRLRATELGLEKVDTDYSSYGVFDRGVMDLVGDGGYELIRYRPKAGQILVWHENLAHGGSPRADMSKTRLSIVSHYFARGGVAYYDSRGEAAALEALPEVGS